MLADELVRSVAARMRQAVAIREKARVGLAEVQSDYAATLPEVPNANVKSLGWSILSQDFNGRIDTAPYQPSIRAMRATLARAGGKPLREVATAIKPLGRYKTVYVDRANGIPILSGGSASSDTAAEPKIYGRARVDRYSEVSDQGGVDRVSGRWSIGRGLRRAGDDHSGPGKLACQRTCRPADCKGRDRSWQHLPRV